jgi:hypothetical protein
VGLGIGGEAKPRDDSTTLAQWQAFGSGYTHERYFRYLKAVIQKYAQCFKKTPLAVLPDSTFISGGGQYIENTFTSYVLRMYPQIWLQYDSLTNHMGSGQNVYKQAIQRPMEALAPAGAGNVLGYIQAALNIGANYILLFSADIKSTDPRDIAALDWAVTQISS